MKILLAVPLLLLSAAVAASDSCGLSYDAGLYVGLSEGSFDIHHQDEDVEYTKTDNNASSVGGNLRYRCGNNELKYTYYTGVDYTDAGITTSKYINSITFTNDQYGSLVIGRISTPYKLTGKKGDPFWDTPAGTTSAGNNFGLSDMTRGFTNRSAVYRSPFINSIQLTLGYSGDDSNGDVQAGIEYKKAAIVLGVQYIDMGSSPYIANNNGNKAATRLYGQYALGQWIISGSFEDVKKQSEAKANFYNLSLDRKITGFGRVALSYGQVSNTLLKLIDGSRVEGDGTGFSTGVFFDVTDNLETYLLTSVIDFDGDIQQKTIAIGFNLNFHIN
ncbi:porin-like protein [Sinobacterium caligoides]|uniref:Porin-like protein n=1 Tax=Sinobacterium caligoides TaxID=933926 RepID=A0A3N2DQQ7_9GAMM|nr:porin [Sinobacterium caligoides]ROS01645.1 porin-like protein [Sinobacterium caligoides]